MSSYVFDGSFEGLLTAIYDSYYNHEIPNRILADGLLQESIFDKTIQIVTDCEKAARVYNSIVSKISPEALQNVFLAYLSDIEDSPIWIYEYLKLGWRVGSVVDLDLANDRVLRIHKLCQNVTREKHLFLGLIRFEECCGNFFYSSIEPDHNILPLISPHFARRMVDQNWIIHDKRRGLYTIYNRKEWFISNVGGGLNKNISSNEHFYQELWKQYFRSISIKSRTNPKLQRKNMPQRYWKHLVEIKK